MAGSPTSSAVQTDLESAPAEQPLLAEAEATGLARQPLGYHSGRRTYKDVAFLVLFLVALAATIGGGIYGALHRNPDFLDLVGKDSLNNPDNCPLYRVGETPLLNPLRSEEATIGALSATFLPPIGLTLGASFILGFLLLRLLKTAPFAMVYATVAIVALYPALVGFSAYFLTEHDRQADSRMFLYPLGITAILTGIFWYIRDKLALTARLLRCSAAALQENLSLLGFVALMQIVAAVVWVPIPLLIAVSYTDGRLVPNPDLKPGQSCGAQYDVTCCAWQPKSWFLVYAALAGVVSLWLASLMSHIQSFTISGVIAQWYFSEVGSRDAAPIRKNLGLALGPSLGTLCLSSLIVTVISLIKDALENAKEKLREGGTEGLIASCFVFCLEAILAGIEFVTKFTIITVAVTGASFCTAAQRTFELLRRNLLSSVTVDSVSVWVLNLGTLVLSTAWAAVVGLFCYRRWSHHSAPGFDQEDAGFLGTVEGVTCFLVAMVLLRLFSQVLLSVVDTVYICYAMDKDQGEVTKPVVHEIYEELPSVKKGRRDPHQEIAQSVDEGYGPPVQGFPAVDSGRGAPVSGYPASRTLFT